METAREVLRAGVYYAGNEYCAARGVDVLVICTEWPQFEDIDWGVIKKCMRGSTVIDGRNMFDRGCMEALGFNYIGIGT